MPRTVSHRFCVQSSLYLVVIIIEPQFAFWVDSMYLLIIWINLLINLLWIHLLIHWVSLFL